MSNKQFTAFDKFLKILDEKDNEGIEIPDFIFEECLRLKEEELSNLIKAYDNAISDTLLGIGPENGKEYIVSNYYNYVDNTSYDYGDI